TPRSLTPPLRHTFPLHLRLHYYQQLQLKQIILPTPQLLPTSIHHQTPIHLPKPTPPTPTLPNTFFKPLPHFQQLNQHQLITIPTTTPSLQLLQLHHQPLHYIHHKIMNSILQQYKPPPVPLHTIPLSIPQQPLTIEHLYHPFLIQKPFIQPTPTRTKPTPYPFQHFTNNNTNNQ
ncbi:Holliday junction DNA helicase RuvB C-terminal domain-containing protein, partial [Staphylococcus saprophyticus]|uniref:Holliday junction DNA helicase RuvB C-terminal domain-containing protein n=1 Tax=Staphylococcus saprophyticus TaxID=29385 RepID=UPI0028CB1970